MQTETVSVDQFRGTCGSFLTGITIATVFGKDNQPHGITVNSFTSVSLAPPLVLICVDCRSRFMAHLADAANFGINILKEDQQDLSRRFRVLKWRDSWGSTGI